VIASLHRLWRRGKSALQRARCRIASGARNSPKTESDLPDRATEINRLIEVRVKRWCKRPPARVVTFAAGQPPSRDDVTARHTRVSGRLHEVHGNVRPRQMIAQADDREEAFGCKPVPPLDRMRLIDRPGENPAIGVTSR